MPSTTGQQPADVVQSIALAGPGSTLLSYVVVGIFVYTVVITLSVVLIPYFFSSLTDSTSYRGEMSAMFPVSGAFSVFGSRFVSPALGFTLGE